jgi:hypothetical protein
MLDPYDVLAKITEATAEAPLRRDYLRAPHAAVFTCTA